MGSDRLGRGARSWGGPRRKTPPSPATEPRHDCELSVSGGVHGGHTHEGRTKEDDGTQGAGPTSCVRRARERKNLAARSQNSRKDGDHNGDEPDDGHAGRRCPRPRLERRLQKALPRPEPVGKRRYRDQFFWQKALPRVELGFFRLRRGVLSGRRLRRAGLFVNVGGSIT